jgi:hypothetical protein
VSWPYYDKPEAEDLDNAGQVQERVHSGRIEPGEVRNPNGRPSGRRNRGLIVRKVALERYAIMDKGRRRKRTAVEIVLLMIRAKAAKGDAAAMKLFDGLQLRFSQREKVPPHAVLILPEKLTTEEFEEQCRAIRDARKVSSTATPGYGRDP